jgi:hypothetical protein
VLAARTALGVPWSTIHFFIVGGFIVIALIVVLALLVFGFEQGAQSEREKLSTDEWILVETYRASQRFDQIDALAKTRMREISSRYRR